MGPLAGPLGLAPQEAPAVVDVRGFCPFPGHSTLVPLWRFPICQMWAVM